MPITLRDAIQCLTRRLRWPSHGRTGSGQNATTWIPPKIDRGALLRKLSSRLLTRGIWESFAMPKRSIVHVLQLLSWFLIDGGMQMTCPDCGKLLNAERRRGLALWH